MISFNCWLFCLPGDFTACLTRAVIFTLTGSPAKESPAERESRLLAHLSCDKESRNALDQRALELIGLGDPSFRYPESDAELELEYCPRVQTASNCIRHYANYCLRPLPRQLVKLFVADNKTESDACQSTADVKRDRMIPMFRCLNKAINSIHSCAARAAHALNHINHHVTGADTEQRFAYTCREFHQLSCCYRQQVELNCPPDLAEIAKVYWDRDSDATAKFLCRFYPPNSAALETLPPLELNHIHSESYGHRHEAQSILLGLIDLYNKASEEDAYKYRFTPIVSVTN